MSVLFFSGLCPIVPSPGSAFLGVANNYVGCYYTFTSSTPCNDDGNSSCIVDAT